MAKTKIKTKTKTVRERGDPRKLSYMTASGPPRDKRGNFISSEEDETKGKHSLFARLFK